MNCVCYLSEMGIRMGGIKSLGRSPKNTVFGFNILRKDNWKPRRETFKFWELVRLIWEILR